MLRKFLVGGAAMILLTAPMSAVTGASAEVPGWFLSGSAAEKYVAFVDNSVAHEGSASGGLAAQTNVEGNEFGALMQLVDARPHIGTRVRLSAHLRTAGVTTGAALWMRVDGVDGEVLSFDNMSRRGLIRGDQPWSMVEVVLDVPSESKVISFGVLLKGEGMVWVDSVSLNPVLRHIATTGFDVEKRLPAVLGDLPHALSNLDFES